MRYQRTVIIGIISPKADILQLNRIGKFARLKLYHQAESKMFTV